MCVRRKEEQQLQYIEKTTFLHFQKFKERRNKNHICGHTANWKQESIGTLEQGQTQPFTVACG